MHTILWRARSQGPAAAQLSTGAERGREREREGEGKEREEEEREEEEERRKKQPAGLAAPAPEGLPLKAPPGGQWQRSRSERCLRL